MSQDVVCQEVGGWGRRKVAPVLQVEFQLPPVCPCASVPPRSCTSQEWAGRRRFWGEWSRNVNFASRAADGNQVSCLVKALSDVLFILSRDAGAPRLYSRSHVHLKKTIWNITIWCGDYGEILHSDFTLFPTQEKIFEGQWHSTLGTWGGGRTFLFSVVNYTYGHQICISVFFFLLSNTEKINVGTQCNYICECSPQRDSVRDGREKCLCHVAQMHQLKPTCIWHLLI